MKKRFIFRLYNNIDYHQVSDVTYKRNVKVPGDRFDYRPLMHKVTSDINGELPSINLLLHWSGI